MKTEKVCPIVTRNGPAGIELLVFRHPLAGTQLVKGTREAAEPLDAAALRELQEESGLLGVVQGEPRWSSTGIAQGQIWHFLTIGTTALPDHFVFHTADDGGHLFRFFWWPLRDVPDGAWHVTFVNAFHEIRAHMR